jgi:hypothetical protein
MQLLSSPTPRPPHGQHNRRTCGGVRVPVTPDSEAHMPAPLLTMPSHEQGCE